MRRIFNKPAFWMIAALLLAGAAAAVFLLTRKEKETPADVLCVETGSDGREREIPVSQNDGAYILKLLASERWLEAEQTERYPFTFTADGAAYFYSPEAHSFSDTNGKRMLSLSYSEWVGMNDILGIETDIPFRVEGASGFSTDPLVRVGVSGTEFGEHNSVTVVWDNSGDEPFPFGSEFCLYRYEDGGFEPVRVKDLCFDLVEDVLMPHSFTLMTYSLEAYGGLEEGEYRLFLNGMEPTGFWVDINVPEEAMLAGLRADLSWIYSSDPGSTGRFVTVYGMRSGGFRYHIAPPDLVGDDISEEELRTLIDENGLSASEARAVLRLIGVPDKCLALFCAIPSGEEKLFSYEVYSALMAEELTNHTSSDPETRLAELQRLHPELFEVDAEQGLEVLVLCNAPASMSFVILPGPMRLREFPELMEVLNGNCRVSSIKDLKLILSYYDLPGESVTLTPAADPFSSYGAPWDEDLIPCLRLELGLDG